MSVIGWSLIILFFTLSSSAPDAIPRFDIPHFDKIGHFGLFFVLTVLLFQALKPLDKMIKWIGLFVYCIFLGVITEYLQTKIPGRSGDVLDLIADLVGSISGFFVTFYINSHYRSVN
ncbi:VanZ family protein [Reichenbachiella sp. MALMAid0571]|uniref:VanZ family protein n=1 Tax=Reichenbachiella sp. MALMAid0571 TaxID=3143939 RepID=UPI0032DFD336